jgi:hypothetical protein
MIPGLEGRLLEGSNEEVIYIGELVCGISARRPPIDLVADTERFI